MQAALWSAFNGVGLALVIPSIQSLTADYHPAEHRGSAFGTLFLVSSMGTPGLTSPQPPAPYAPCSTLTPCFTHNKRQDLSSPLHCQCRRPGVSLRRRGAGGLVGGFMGTNMGSLRHVWGMDGWRIAFHLVALVSLLTSLLVYRFAADPRRKAWHPTGLILPACVPCQPALPAHSAAAAAAAAEPADCMRSKSAPWLAADAVVLPGAAGPDRAPAHGRLGT